MLAGRVLELRAGEPRWYDTAVLMAIIAVIVALLVTPLRWYWALVILVGGGLVAWRDVRHRQGIAGLSFLRVHSDHSLSLIAHDGTEIPGALVGRPWVSPWLIVIAVQLPDTRTERIVVSRDLNDSDAFRRFIVLCRFGFAVEHS